MSDVSDVNNGAGLRYSAPDADGGGPKPPRRKRRAWRIVLVALGSVLGLLVVLAAGGYAYLNHVASSIPRVKVANLVAVGAPGAAPGQTFLVTSSQLGPTGRPVKDAALPTSANLVMILHINADGKHGGAVAIPDTIVVNVPGKGTHPLSYALENGGPSLLVKTVTKVTGIPINHYARIDFSHITNLVNAIGGLDVTIPTASKSYGHTFKKGLNHLTGLTAVYYAREKSLSAPDRTLRQANFVRAVLTKIADDHLITNPVTMVRVLNSITSALTVDSDMNNAEIASLAKNSGNLSGSAGTFVLAPTHTVNGKLVLDTTLAAPLWTAVKHDSIAAFAQQHPSVLTPAIVP